MVRTSQNCMKLMSHMKLVKILWTVKECTFHAMARSSFWNTPIARGDY